MSCSFVFAVVVSKLKAIFASSGNSEKKNEIYLPRELVVLILSRLSHKDNIRASAVCMTWNEVVVSGRDRCPWFVYLDNERYDGTAYGFFDPIEKKMTKPMKVHDISINARVCDSKNEWLLIKDSQVLYFFNPFTREFIKLPKPIGSRLAVFAFSCAPTNKSCVVCGINGDTIYKLNGLQTYHVIVHTWYLGTDEWVTDKFDQPEPSKIFYGSIVFSDGYFWFGSGDGVGLFDPTSRTWNSLHVPLPDPCSSRRWMCEYKGNIFFVEVIHDSSRQRIVVFRFNRLLSVWEKKKTFDGLSIFISGESSIVTNGVNGNMSNIVYMWDSYLNTGRRCKYSLFRRSFYMGTDGYGFGDTSARGISSGGWIEPPHNSSIYDFPIIEPK